MFAPNAIANYGYRLSNGRYQCAQYRHQTPVTAGTVLHKNHILLTQWFLAFYFVCQDKRGISAVQLASNAWKDLQNHLEYAQTHPYCYGSAR